MKDPDVIHPGLFSEDNTTSSEEKVKIIRKIEDVLRATAKGANCQSQDAGAGAVRHTETRTRDSRTRSRPDTMRAEPLVDSGHQDTSASADQETRLDVPTQTVLPTPAPETSQQQPSRTLPSTITGKLYWVVGALVSTMRVLSALFI
ncbi:g8008 [Coccomyxa viridis]|uniref:G8008 protein n=1 Tax=Coccomyxa viridis TaxID=1274662 RepID=A0ABP1G0F5_9CHLO